MHKVFTTSVQLADEAANVGAEPSLLDLVFKYYSAHFPIQRARELTETYFEMLEKTL